ncbi:hypothetical protein L195_g062255, partial [Trifolium pratense]
KCLITLTIINKKLLSQWPSLSEGSASLSEQRQEVTDSWRAVASISELFTERRLSEPKRTTPVDHLLVASCGELFATHSLSEVLASAFCQDSSKPAFSTPNHP